MSAAAAAQQKDPEQPQPPLEPTLALVGSGGGSERVETPVYSGWLQKFKSGKGWKTRYCTLVRLVSGGHAVVYREKPRKREMWRVAVEGSLLEDDAPPALTWSIIDHGGESFTFMAGDAETKRSWVDALVNANVDPEFYLLKHPETPEDDLNKSKMELLAIKKKKAKQEAREKAQTAASARKPPPPPLKAPPMQGTVLHVRGVGGELEDEDALSTLFSQFGGVVQATVRHRIDKATGANTSWALVTMMGRKGADAALATTIRHHPDRPPLVRFSNNAHTRPMWFVELVACALTVRCLHRW